MGKFRAFWAILGLLIALGYIWHVDATGIRGDAVGGVSQIIAGNNITISPITGKGAVTITGASGGSSVSEFSTDTYRFSSGGDAFQTIYSTVIRTIGEQPIPGAVKFVSRTTGTSVGFQAFSVVTSTVGSTFLYIGESTGGALPIWSMVSPILEISTANGSNFGYSGYVSSAIPITPNKYFGMFCSSFPVTGIPTSGFGINMEAWMRKTP